MNILLLAPHPFFQERGTPIAVDLLLRVLSQDGHRIDVLTYHEGETRSYPGVTLHRIPPPPGVRSIPPGFSVKKLVCDAWMILPAFRLARRLRPNRIHAVEESVFLAAAIRAVLGIPYLYDMDSHLAAQLVEKHAWMGIFTPLFRRLEGAAVRRADAVAPVCPALADVAASYGAKHVVLLQDVSLINPSPDHNPPDLPPADGLRVLYVGNLEAYQGIDLLLDAFARARSQAPGLTLTIVGGAPQHLRHYQSLARAQGLHDAAQWIGPRPVEQLGAVLAAADILVSPRIQGVNTPMKIYSYLHAGKPLLATRLPTHTQVLTDEIACLADPTPPAWAAALLALARDPARRQSLGRAARAYAETHHTLDAFTRQAHRLYPPPP